MEKIGDLTPGMVLEGVVTNVAAFGAFVDVGVHQDGLVHVSAMSRTFVKDPREVVKSGDVVRVRVLDVDVPRKRISLTLRLEDEPGAGTDRARDGQGARSGRPGQGGQDGRGGPDQRGSQGGRGAQDQRGSQGGRGGQDQRGSQGGRGGQQRQGRGGGAPAPANDAMAEALRRAGLA
ncbi:hypothetical protein GCM10027614_74250 [Micromonospora vulcania]